jgi:hypothetical protein
MLYKRYVRQIVSRHQKQNPGLTLGQIAQSIGIESSYLSRFLGDLQTHFSEELLYRLWTRCQGSQAEFDHLLLLREFDRSPHPERRQHLESKIRAARAARWTPELNKLKQEIESLLKVMEQL